MCQQAQLPPYIVVGLLYQGRPQTYQRKPFTWTPQALPKKEKGFHRLCCGNVAYNIILTKYFESPFCFNFSKMKEAHFDLKGYWSIAMRFFSWGTNQKIDWERCNWSIDLLERQKMKCVRNWASAVFDLSRSRNIGKYRKLAKYWQIAPTQNKWPEQEAFYRFHSVAFISG